jgi:hypothetical protein
MAGKDNTDLRERPDDNDSGCEDEPGLMVFAGAAGERLTRRLCRTSCLAERKPHGASP